jgi:hypothetical protein
LNEAWPPLPLDGWKQTRDTVHMYAQIVGKVRLALAPMEPQWAQVPLYVTARGLTTSPIPYQGRAFAIAFDLVAHELDIEVSDGERRTFALGPRAVAAFYEEVMSALRSLGIEVAYRARPVEIPHPISFLEDSVHASYDPVSVNRFFRVLARVDAVLKRHRARFWGRTSPVAFFWGTFDLAYSRYSGRTAEPPPGSDVIYRLGMNVETIEVGFWPGDERFPEPAFYGFTYPMPQGIERASIGPREAFWSAELGEFLLRYEDVRRAEDPESAALEFFETTYRAGATLAGWDVAAFDGPAARAA